MLRARSQSPRAFTVVGVVAAVLIVMSTTSGCTSKGNPANGAEADPTTAWVSMGQYVKTVDLGGGTLLVSPPPGGTKAKLPETSAWSIFESSDTASGSYAFAILGLGVVSVVPPSGAPVPASPASTTSTAPGSSSTTSTLTHSGTSTTTSSTSSSSATSSTSTSVPGTGPPASSTTTTTPLPTYKNRLAWVGIAWGSGQGCPATSSTEGTKRSEIPEVAIIVDAQNGHDVLGYTNGISPSCGAQSGSASMALPDQIVSVAWHPVGPASTAVSVNMPACGHYYGWTQVSGTGSQPAVQVLASVPFDPSCGVSAPSPVEVDDVVPLGSAQNQVPHAALGPVQELRVLPGG